MKIEGAEDWTMTLVISGPKGISMAKSQRVGVNATVVGGDPAGLLGGLQGMAARQATSAFRDLVYIHFGGVDAVRAIDRKQEG